MKIKFFCATDLKQFDCEAASRVGSSHVNVAFWVNGVLPILHEKLIRLKAKDNE